MDILDQITNGWVIIKNAPALAFGLIVAGATAAWWLKNQIARGRAETLEERLNLAADRYTQATDDKNRLEAELEKLRQQIATHAPLNVLASTTSSVLNKVLQFDQAWTDVGTSLTTRSLTSAEFRDDRDNTVARRAKRWMAGRVPIRNLGPKTNDEKKD